MNEYTPISTVNIMDIYVGNKQPNMYVLIEMRENLIHVYIELSEEKKGAWHYTLFAVVSLTTSC